MLNNEYSDTWDKDCSLSGMIAVCLSTNAPLAADSISLGVAGPLALHCSGL